MIDTLLRILSAAASLAPIGGVVIAVLQRRLPPIEFLHDEMAQRMTQLKAGR